jgi:polyisoprenyl-phosphate glycosyltransferase
VPLLSLESDDGSHKTVFARQEEIIVNKIRLIVPVYNDWQSFGMLLRELESAAASLPFQIFVSAVDDGSTEDILPALGDLSGLRHLVGAEIVSLSVNVGHQRAIAIGLCVAAHDHDFDAALIMDADGEDPPHSIDSLTRNIGGRKDFCFVAQRRKRVETSSFKFFYILYKCFFKVVTGKTISFGNFCVISSTYVDRLVMIADLWNNLPAAILRSRLPLNLIPIHRGRRYAGKSKMNFTSLIVHGLSGMSVYADTIFVRLLILSFVLVIVSVMLISGLLTLRIFFPAHATPGWTTTIAFGLTIIILQVLFTALSSILMLLNNRVQRLVIPKLDYPAYLKSRSLLFGQRFAPPSEGLAPDTND